MRTHVHTCVRASSVCVCVRACVRACVRVYVVCVRACVRAGYISQQLLLCYVMHLEISSRT